MIPMLLAEGVFGRRESLLKRGTDEKLYLTYEKVSVTDKIYYLKGEKFYL
jgi:hypothetical protein